MSCGSYSLKTTLYDRFLRNFSWQFYLYARNFLQKSAERKSPKKCIHTHIICHYNPSVRIIELVSHTTYVVCVNFTHKWRNLQFKSRLRTTDFLRNFSWQFFNLLSESFARNLLTGNRKRNIFCILF